jgi:hypothetical protein
MSALIGHKSSFAGLSRLRHDTDLIQGMRDETGTTRTQNFREEVYENQPEKTRN